MRHPPSVCCLFGQTGCLTAQAVDGILIVMTNDSLSIPPDSFLFAAPLALLVGFYVAASRMKCLPLKRTIQNA